MTRLDTTPVDRDIGLRIGLASRALAKHRAGRLRMRHLTPKGATALVLVDANPGITQADLARYFSNGRTTMHGIIQELLSEGLLEGRATDTRGQAVALHVKPKGKAAVAFELDSIDAQFEFCCEVIGQAATLQLMDHLLKLCAAAEAFQPTPLLSMTGDEP
ncbi:MarR family winged helix-turn-helix transcriptional regulator [Novosphingobium sp.]|uniref:MarR family winged helix-turn-helix transcriptional regulator n=1 Tax=Novosphingobium sp. TaxID=1874826 RepID=UPI003BABB7B3